MKDGLNMRQRKFVDFYLQTGSKKEACRLAGYSDNKNNLETRGTLVMKDERVQKELEKRYQQMRDKTEGKTDSEAEGLTVLDIKKSLENLAVNGKTDATKLRALELYGKTMGLFIDRQITSTENKELYESITLEKFNENEPNKITVERKLIGPVEEKKETKKE